MRASDPRLRRVRHWTRARPAEPSPAAGRPAAPQPTAPPADAAGQAGARIWAVVPVKGRLSFLQQTASRVLAEAPLHYCLSDYSCPEASGDWFEHTFGKDIASGRAVVHRVLDRPTFNKSCAHNAGAWRAIHEGAEYLCFLDADTVVLPGFGEYVARHVRPGKFLIAGLAPGGVDVASLTGLLVVPARAFAAVGGFDESFQGWGGEDIELRLRLHLVGGLSYGEVPLELLHPIQHDDSLRTRFYEERSVARSNATNMQRIREKMRSWPARPESSARLWFRRGAELVQPSRAATQPGEYRPEHPRRAAAARVARAVTRPRRVS